MTDTTDQQAVTVSQVLQEIVNATTVGKRGSCVTRSKYGSYPSSLYHAAVAALATQPATSQEGEDAPRVAAFHAIYGTNADLFESPEGYAFASDVADAVTAATPTPPTLSEDLPSCERCRKPSPQGLRCYDCLSGEVDQLRFEADRYIAQSDPASAVALLLRLANDEDSAILHHEDPKDRGRCAIIAAEFRRVAKMLSSAHDTARAALAQVKAS